jgi:hypothetical protein
MNRKNRTTWLASAYVTTFTRYPSQTIVTEGHREEWFESREEAEAWARPIETVQDGHLGCVITSAKTCIVIESRTRVSPPWTHTVRWTETYDNGATLPVRAHALSEEHARCIHAAECGKVTGFSACISISDPVIEALPSNAPAHELPLC